MNKMIKQTSIGQRVLTGALALLMTLTSFAGVGGTMAADVDSGDGSAIVEEARGGVSVQSFTQDFLSNELEGDASLLGAEFTVYDADGEEVCVIKTNEEGFATTGATALPIGTYSIKQTKASEGYRLNSVWQKEFEIKEDAQVINLTDGYRWTDAFDFESNDPADAHGVANEIIRGGLRVYASTKDRSETGNTSDDNLGEGDADLAGAEFLIVNASAAPVMVNGQKFQRGKAVLTIWSNENGIAETAADALPYGRYEVYQIESPDGLYIDSRFVATVAIREDGVIVDGNTYDGKPIQQAIYRGGFEMQKIDALLNEAIAQGDASLEGAVFGVVNNSTHDVYVGGQWYKPGEVCHSVVTNADGYANAMNLVLPYGTYSIIEMTASAGYQVNKEFKIDFQIREDGKVYDLTGTAFPEYVITGDVQIVKNDIELGKSEAIGGKNHGENEFGTDLNGITYAITNKSAKAVVVDGKLYQPGEVVATISTHWNASANAYTAETENGLLPYGTYSIQEISTNAYYKLTDTTVYTFQIRKQGEVVSADVNGNKMVYANQVIRGDIMFEAIEDYSESRMSTLWVLTNVSSGERHVLVTDQNGEYLSHTDFGFAHTAQTNANDALLSKIDAGEVIAMADVIQGAGTWFGLGEAGSMSAANDDLGALPYGKYNLKEVATDSNADYHRELKSFDFYIYRDGKVVDLGTIENDHAAPTASLSGEAIDDTTGSQMGIAIENTTIVDTVSYDNLVAGYTYKLIGTLYSKNSGGPLAVPDGKGGFTNVVVEHEFTAAQSSGEIDMVYNFNGSELAGDSVVVYLTLIDVYKNSKGELVENKILDSNDINNAKQTVVYPTIDSELVFDETDTHDSAIGSNMIVIDTVYYENLIPGRNYTVEGTLMDIATGNDAVDANGNDIHASVTFTADAASGSVKLTYRFDASNMAGKTLVAFADILYRNAVIARHNDLNAAGQMIYFPAIDTKANCETTGNNEGVVNSSVVIEDVVSFKGLIPNEDYTLTGKLIDVESGDVVADVVKTFKTGTSEGFVSVMFNVDSTVLAGKTVVAVEYLTRSNNALAEHVDMSDVDQTITFPAIDAALTIADSEDRMSGVGEKTVLIDTVDYSNLVVGEEYKVVGALMDKFSGAPVVDANDEAIVAEVVFKPESADGSVEVRFEFDSRHLAGDSVVAYAFLYRNDVMLVKHADIEDDAQTIAFAAIETSLSDKISNDREIAVDAVILTDVVSYKNLIAGAEYEVKTILMDKDTGKALDGFEAIVTKFKPESADGDIAIEIKLDATKLAGKTIVAYETISRDGKIVIAHEDIEDIAQTVTIPMIDGAAVLNDTGVVDTIQYKNLRVDRMYIMISEIVTVDGKVLDKVVATFVPKTEMGMIKARIDFTFDMADYAGQNVIIRESLYGQMGQFLCMDETVLAIPAEEIAPPVTEPPATEPPVEETEPSDDGKYSDVIVDIDVYDEANGGHELARDEFVKVEASVNVTYPEAYSDVMIAVELMLFDKATGETLVDDEGNAIGYSLYVGLNEFKDIDSIHLDTLNTTAIGEQGIGVKARLTFNGDLGEEIVDWYDTGIVLTVAAGEQSDETTPSDPTEGTEPDDGNDEGTTPPTEGTEPPATEDPGDDDVTTPPTEGTEPPATEDPDDDVTPLPHVHTHMHVDTINPTCIEAGYEIWTCVCGDTYTRMNASALGHSWGEWVVTKEATVDAEGEETRACSVCQVTETRAVEKLTDETPDDTQPEDKPTDPTEGTESEKEQPFGDVEWKYYDKATKGTALTWGTDVKVGYEVAIHDLRSDYDYKLVLRLVDAETGKPIEVEYGDFGMVPVEFAGNIDVGEGVTDFDYSAVNAFIGMNTTEMAGRKFKCELIISVKGEGETEYKTALQEMGETVLTVTAPVEETPEDTQPEDKPTDPTEGTKPEEQKKPEVSVALQSYDKATGEKALTWGTGVVIGNKVIFDKLPTGYEYSFDFKLMDNETNKVIEIDGTSVGCAIAINRVMGGADVEKTHMTSEFPGIDTTKLNGKKLRVDMVVRAKVNGEFVIVAEVKGTDILTITEPEDDLYVTVISVKTGTSVLEIHSDVKIKNTVEYKNLTVGETYVVTSTLLDADGKVVKDKNGENMVVTETFIAQAKDGKIELTFAGMKTSALQGKKFTAHTVIMHNGKTLVSESKDEVYVADLDTKATSDKKTKYLILGKNVVLVDTVEYFNLIPGQKYYIEGKVVNAKDGKLVLGAQGKDPVVKLSFTPTEANGKLEMKFYLDTSNANGETYVVVQTLYDANGNVIAYHQNLTDKDQSVVIKTIADVQTGVYENAGLITVLAVVTMLAGVAFVIIGRKRNLFGRR